ncbi:MAG TPA: tRNA (N6-isopentenyl adenosine(37)-C2)-methylthiotransferase MiaB, partial [Thermoanaerobaculia bacterium]|nr:tRNA (N6-isopentenyl adenosine(37)-C2)-methylthiotransferase MiaB [Thermoanaerobaculia bacterium]
MSRRRFYIETWGCQMNELDSRRMAGQLVAQGMLPADDAAEADLILLNSCSVREKAVHKVYSRLGEYRRLKQDRPDLRIGLCGCVAQQEGERALARVGDLDFVLGPARVGELG